MGALDVQFDHFIPRHRAVAMRLPIDREHAFPTYLLIPKIAFLKF
jgi:hypothetical protein